MRELLFCAALLVFALARMISAEEQSQIIWDPADDIEPATYYVVPSFTPDPPVVQVLPNAVLPAIASEPPPFVAVTEAPIERPLFALRPHVPYNLFSPAKRAEKWDKILKKYILKKQKMQNDVLVNLFRLTSPAPPTATVAPLPTPATHAPYIEQWTKVANRILNKNRGQLHILKTNGFYPPHIGYLIRTMYDMEHEVERLKQQLKNPAINHENPPTPVLERDSTSPLKVIRVVHDRYPPT